MGRAKTQGQKGLGVFKSCPATMVARWVGERGGRASVGEELEEVNGGQVAKV